MFKPLALSNAFLAPPGMPAQRVAELRKAFTATMSDPDLIAEAEKIMKEPPSPTSGEDMQKLMNEMYATPEDISRSSAACWRRSNRHRDEAGSETSAVVPVRSPRQFNGDGHQHG